MPGGTYVIDTRQTFQTAILMGSAPKTKFGTTEQDVSQLGEKKWAVEAAVTHHAQAGMRPVSEVISITITGPADHLVVTDATGRILSSASLARPPTQPPPAVKPYPGPTGERADWWWYTPFEPQASPTTN